MKIQDYLPIVGKDTINQVIKAAEPLNQKKVIHVNSTKIGGGVAEILMKMNPLMQSLGIDSSWEIITGTPEFYHCTKNFHNALQGNTIEISPNLYRIYEDINASQKLDLNDADFVIIHDPQPCALISQFPKRKGKWLWRCHIDVSQPNQKVWNYLKKWIAQYDASIFTMKDFAQDLPHPIFFIPPSIDPLSPKNCDLTVQPSYQPTILQVSRFDRFKDPLGVIQAYKIAKKSIPDLQLILAGGTADDDPEGAEVLLEVEKAAKGDPDIKIMLLPPDAHRTINVLQRSADVVLQKSLKEGFGLTVTEALWKKKPVVGGNVGGIRLQVKNGETGFLVDSPEEAAKAIVTLLKNKELCQTMGEKGHELVLKNFLITRHLCDYLKAMSEIGKK